MKAVGKTVRSIYIGILAICMAGCGSAKEQSVTTTAAVPQQTKEQSGETLKLITWTNDSTIDALEQLGQQFYEETGITLEVSHVPATDYEAFLEEKMESGDVDIFCYTADSKAFAQPKVDWAPSELLTWEKIIQEGKALDLSGCDFLANWSTGAKACEYNGGTYGIATGMTIMNGMFYNKKMFEEHGWKEPRTWDEFVNLCEDVQKAGIAPICVGGADRWPVQMITNAIVDSVEEGNCAKLSEGLWRGTHLYTDAESMEIYEREYQILTYMEKDFLQMPYDACPAYFTAGEAAMMYDGSWASAEIEKIDPSFSYDYFAIPGDSKHNFTGKYDLTFGVYAASPNTDAALSWLDFFSKPDNYTVYIDKNGFVPTMSWISTSNRFLRLIDDRIGDADRTFECYNRVPVEGDSLGTYDLIHYAIAGGEFETPEEFAEGAQKAWDEELSQLVQ